MKKLILPLALVAAAPLAAQSVELGIFIGQQTYKDVSAGGSTLEASKKTVTGVRFGYSVVDLGPALFQLTAGYQPESKTELKEDGLTAPGVEFSHKHWSVGAMFNFKAFVAVGAGVEYRSESLDITGTGGGYSTTYGRPWARVNAGVAFPTPLVKPFVGLEVAAPLTSKSYAIGDSQQDLSKSLAPKMQIGVYGGIRF